jgi:hypothetical protein
MTISYEVNFEILHKSRLRKPEPYFQVFGTMPEVKAFIQRLTKVASADRKLPEPPDPKSYSDLITSKYPANGYRFTIVRVNREIIMQRKRKWS